MGITLKGGSLVTVKRIKDIDKRFIIGVRQGFFIVGHTLVDSVQKETLKRNKTGRIYKIRRGKSTRQHRASSPGETPANRTGTYRKSMGFQINGWRAMQFGSRGDEAYYSKFLEVGTRRMKPRPGLKNALKAESAKIRQQMEGEIRKALT